MEIRQIDTLHEWDKNQELRRISPQDFERLKKNLEYGQHSPLLIRPNGTVIGGNNRLRAMRELNYKEVECTILEFAQDEKGLYPILNGHVYKNSMGEIPYHFNTEEEGEIALAFSHNTNPAYYNSEGVANIIGNFPNIEWVSFDASFVEPINLGTILNQLNETVEDEVPALQDEAVSKLGEIYQLGRHRLMCGDATKIEDVEKLMNGQKADLVVTDPPYNTGMNGNTNTFNYDWGEKKSGSTWLSHMFNDDLSEADFQVLIVNSLTNMYAVTKGECAFYMFIDWRNMAYIKEEIETLMPVKNIIVWDKVVHGLGSDYKFTYEMCVVGKKGNPEIKNRIGSDYQDIWRLQRTMGRNDDHATAKPVALITKPILHASKQDDIVLDLFGGSGTTLIASEQSKRNCYMMELDPRYCDVIRKRYWKLLNNDNEENWQENTKVV